MLLRIGLLLIASVASEEGKWPGCLEGGIAYTNLLDISDAYAKKRLVQEPNGGYLANAKDSCKLAPHCKKFTFKTGSDPPGACFLIDTLDDLTHRYAENDAISGSVSCNFSVIPSMPTPPEPAGGPAAKSAGDKSAEAVEGAAGNEAVDAATSAAEGAAASTGEVAAAAASTGTAAVDEATSAAEGAAAGTGEVAATAAPTGTAAVDAATSAAEGAAASTGEVAATAAPTGTAAVDAATSASTDAAGTIRAKMQAASPSASATKALLFPAGSACTKTGMLLQDSLLPAPVEWTETAEKCQQTCQTSKTCALFSWKADSNPAGGCWLFPERSSPLGQISDPKATSGPKECLSSEDLEQGPGKAFISQSPSGFDSNTLWLILAGAATAAALGGMAAFVSTGSKRKSKRGLTVAAGDEEMATPIAPSPMFAPPSARAGSTPTYQTPGFQPVVYQRLPLPQQTYQIHQVPQVFYSQVAQ